MKKLSCCEGCVLSGLDEKQKKQSIFVILSVALFFVLSAFTFMNFLYCLSDCVGSIVCASADVSLRDAVRSGPIFLSFFLSLSGLMVAHTFYRNESAELLRKRAKKHAIIGIVIGAIILVYVIAMLIAGKYLSLVEGGPSLLYPLDAVLYALLYIALDILLLVYFKKAAGTHPFSGPSRIPLSKSCRWLRNIFRTFWLLIGLYGFCGFFYSLFIVDFANGYFSYSIAVMIVSLICFLSIAVWELYYNNLTEEKRKETTLPLAIISLVVSLAATVFYFLALKGNLDGPSNVGFGILPVAFAASVNFATLIVVATPLIFSAVALIKGLIRRRSVSKD